jgi:hypothetical protein
VFQVEIWCALEDWKRIPPIVEVTFHTAISPLVDFFQMDCQEIGRSDPQGVDTTESIADILVRPSYARWRLSRADCLMGTK